MIADFNHFVMIRGWAIKTKMDKLHFNDDLDERSLQIVEDLKKRLSEPERTSIFYGNLTNAVITLRTAKSLERRIKGKIDVNLRRIAREAKYDEKRYGHNKTTIANTADNNRQYENENENLYSFLAPIDIFITEAANNVNLLQDELHRQNIAKKLERVNSQETVLPEGQQNLLPSPSRRTKTNAEGYAIGWKKGIGKMLALICDGVDPNQAYYICYSFYKKELKPWSEADVPGITPRLFTPGSDEEEE